MYQVLRRGKQTHQNSVLSQNILMFHCVIMQWLWGGINPYWCLCCTRILEPNQRFFCKQYCDAKLQYWCASCLEHNGQTLLQFLMFITKLMVNLFHKPAIYACLTFKFILNTILPVSRLESMFTIMMANSFKQLAHQYCNIASQYCLQKNNRFGSKFMTSCNIRTN